MFKFRDQLLITLLLVGLLPAILISYQTFSRNSAEVKAFSIDLSQRQLKSVASGLADAFEEAEKYVALYSRDERLQSMRYAQFMPFLTSELQHLKPHFEKFIVGKPNGEFFNTSGANLFQGGIRTFDDSSASAKPKNIRKRDYWQRTIINNTEATSLTYVSNPMISFTTGVKQVVIASSILDNQDHLVGMVGLSIGWQRINTIIDELILENFSDSKGPTKLMLIAHDGTYWYHWQKNKVIKLLKDKNGQVLLNNDGENAVQKSNILEDPNPSLMTIGRKMTSGKSGVEIIETEDQLQYVIYQPIKGSQYSIGLVVDNEDILAPVYQALEHYIRILLVSCLLILIIGVLIARYFSYPIDELVRKIALLSAGKQVDQSSETQTRELFVLSTAIFNLYDQIYQQ